MGGGNIVLGGKMGYIRCYSCGEDKPSSQYGSHKASVKNFKCKVCVRKVREQRIKNTIENKPYIKCKTCGLAKLYKEYIRSDRTVTGFLGSCKVCVKGSVREIKHKKDENNNITCDDCGAVHNERKYSKKGLSYKKPKCSKCVTRMYVKAREDTIENNPYIECVKCKVVKKYTDYYKDRNKVTGFRTICKQCFNKERNSDKVEFGKRFIWCPSCKRKRESSDFYAVSRRIKNGKCKYCVISEGDRRRRELNEECGVITCSKCGLSKKTEEYSKDNDTYTGYRGVCRVCVQSHRKDVRKNWLSKKYIVCASCNKGKSSKDFIYSTLVTKKPRCNDCSEGYIDNKNNEYNDGLGKCSVCKEYKRNDEMHGKTGIAMDLEDICLECTDKRINSFEGKFDNIDISENRVDEYGRMVCNKCGVGRSKVFFSKNEYTTTGYDYTCKLCKGFLN
jgi:hypothetical protein